MNSLLFLISINGIEMPSPSKFNVRIEDRGDDSVFNVRGQRVVDRLAVKRLIDVTWPYLAGDAAAALMAAVTDGIFFTVAYPDPMEGGMREAECRALERSAKLSHLADGSAVWRDVVMKWEER